MNKNSIFYPLVSDQKFRIILYISFIVYGIILIFGPGPTGGDTPTNLEAITSLLNGKPDSIRTPLYPLFLLLPKLLIKNDILFKISIIIIQFIIFNISIFYLYSLLKLYSRKKEIQLSAIAVYACYPALLVWHKIIMTESLAIAIGIFFLYHLLQYLKKKHLSSISYINGLLFLLLLLRPSFLFLIPLTFTFFLYTFIKKYPFRNWGLLSNGLVIMSIVVYCFFFQKVNGIFNMSTVSDINQYMILREAGLIDTKTVNNRELKLSLEATILHKKPIPMYFDEYNYYCKKFGIARCHHIISSSIKNNKTAYLKHNLERIKKESCHSQVGFWSSFNYNSYNFLMQYLCLPFIALYFFLLIYPFWFCWKKSLFDDADRVFSLFNYGFIMLNLITIIIGAPDSWGRLIVPAIPSMILLGGQIAEWLLIKTNNSDSDADGQVCIEG